MSHSELADPVQKSERCQLTQPEFFPKLEYRVTGARGRAEVKNHMAQVSKYFLENIESLRNFGSHELE